MRLLPVLLSTLLLDESTGFLARSFCPRYRSNLNGNLDYEYFPPDRLAQSTFSSDLPSAYPEGTPAGLRGEAVQSALRAENCVAWRLHDSLAHGIVQAQGKGALEFLNNKLTQSFSDNNSFQEAALLNARGRIIDRIGVAVTEKETAYMLTSAGHASRELFERLDPFVFPLDQVQLTDTGLTTTIFSLSSVRSEYVQAAFDKHIMPLLEESLETSPPVSGWKLPDNKQCLSVPLKSNASLLILPTSGLAPNAVYGYTFCFLSARELGESIWDKITSETNPTGPVPVELREFESLRIASGQVAYGAEMIAHLQSKQQKSKTKDNDLTPPTPLELHLDAIVNSDKGCYLGQEGIAAQAKNPRGPPRTLYQVVFEDEFNIYQEQSQDVENQTHLPMPGAALYVLGSNQQIQVGSITSIAEPGSTGTAETVGLALIRRSDSILKQMQSMDLSMPARELEQEDGLLLPPPLDPLDGLEVIVKDSFTVGTLRVVPWRKLRPGQILFQTDEENAQAAVAVSMTNDVLVESMDTAETAIDAVVDMKMDSQQQEEDGDDDDDLEKAMEQAAKAQEEAEAAAAEAQRKAEKMEMLKKRAEAAMARRKERKQ